jgi:hypothetical protein
LPQPSKAAFNVHRIKILAVLCALLYASIPVNGQAINEGAQENNKPKTKTHDCQCPPQTAPASLPQQSDTNSLGGNRDEKKTQDTQPIINITMPTAI